MGVNCVGPLTRQTFFNTFSIGSPYPQGSHPQFQPEHVRQNTVTGSDTATKWFRALDKSDAHSVTGSNSVSPCWDLGSGLRRERLLLRMSQCSWLCKSCLNDGKAFWLRPEWACWQNIRMGNVELALFAVSNYAGCMMKGLMEWKLLIRQIHLVMTTVMWGELVRGIERIWKSS